MHPERRRRQRCLARAAVGLVVLLAAALPASQAATVADALAARMAQHDEARRIQRRIDALAGKRQSLAASLEDQRLADALEQARSELGLEQARANELARSLAAGRDAQSGIVPLLEAMLDLLADSIAADLPFEAGARARAVASARADLGDAKLTMADRYDAVIDLYRRELRYGYTSDAQRSRIEIDGEPRLATLLRVGRIALYALSDDASSCHIYALAERAWRPLSRAECVRLDAVRDDPALAVTDAGALSVARP